MFPPFNGWLWQKHGWKAWKEPKILLAPNVDAMINSISLFPENDSSKVSMKSLSQLKTDYLGSFSNCMNIDLWTKPDSWYRIFLRSGSSAIRKARFYLASRLPVKYLAQDRREVELDAVPLLGHYNLIGMKSMRFGTDFQKKKALAW